MPVISTELLNQALDLMATGYAKTLGTSGSGYGMGEPEGAYGTADAMVDLLALLGGESDPIIDMGRAARTMRDSLSSIDIVAAKARPWIASLDRHLRRFGGVNYSSLETLLPYLNVGGGGTWAALQDYRWGSLYPAIKPNRALEQSDLYFEVLQGSTYANGLRSLLVGTGQTAGFEIDDELYAGGIPALLVSDFAGSSSTVTVTGDFYDPATETVETGETATFTVAGNGRVYRNAGSAAANALILRVTGIVDTGGNLTASTLIYAEAERPALRSGTCGADTVSNSTVGLDDNASSENDFYVGLQIGTNADRYTWRTITDYDGNTKLVTISGTWATNPTASTSLFRVLRRQVA